MKIIVGITGQYSSGKSNVGKIFVEHGFIEIDIDKYGHNALKDLKTELVNQFGIEIMKEGNIDRASLGKIVFSDSNKLSILNSIVHPFMKKEIIQDINTNKNDKIIINGALLIPMGLNIHCDIIVAVISDEEQIIRRGIKRDNRNIDQIKLILLNQPTSNQLINKADYIIENNDTIDDLKNKTELIINKILMEK